MTLGTQSNYCENVAIANGHKWTTLSSTRWNAFHYRCHSWLKPRLVVETDYSNTLLTADPQVSLQILKAELHLNPLHLPDFVRQPWIIGQYCENG